MVQKCRASGEKRDESIKWLFCVSFPERKNSTQARCAECPQANVSKPAGSSRGFLTGPGRRRNFS